MAFPLSLLQVSICSHKLSTVGWLRRLFGPPAPAPARMRDVLERLDDVEADMAGLRKRVMKLQGMLTGAIRRGDADKTADVDPGPMNGEEPEVYAPPAPIATSNLSRRFRRF